MITYKRGDRVRLKPEAPGSNYCREPEFQGIVSSSYLDSDPAECGEGPVYLVFVGRGFGVMGTGYTMNTADEMEPGWREGAASA